MVSKYTTVEEIRLPFDQRHRSPFGSGASTIYYSFGKHKENTDRFRFSFVAEVATPKFKSMRDLPQDRHEWWTKTYTTSMVFDFSSYRGAKVWHVFMGSVRYSHTSPISSLFYPYTASGRRPRAGTALATLQRTGHSGLIVQLLNDRLDDVLKDYGIEWEGTRGRTGLYHYDNELRRKIYPVMGLFASPIELTYDIPPLRRLNYRHDSIGEYLRGNLGKRRVTRPLIREFEDRASCQLFEHVDAVAKVKVLSPYAPREHYPQLVANMHEYRKLQGRQPLPFVGLEKVFERHERMGRRLTRAIFSDDMDMFTTADAILRQWDDLFINPNPLGAEGEEEFQTWVMENIGPMERTNTLEQLGDWMNAAIEWRTEKYAQVREAMYAGRGFLGFGEYRTRRSNTHRGYGGRINPVAYKGLETGDYNGIRITVPETSQDVVAWGVKQDHCLHVYADSVYDGRYQAIEVETRDGAAHALITNGRISQFYGESNARIRDDNAIRETIAVLYRHDLVSDPEAEYNTWKAR